MELKSLNLEGYHACIDWRQLVAISFIASKVISLYLSMEGSGWAPNSISTIACVCRPSASSGAVFIRMHVSADPLPRQGPYSFEFLENNIYLYVI